MIIIYGTRCYGYVDRVPGFCYVATQFGHLNYLPLFPTKSFVIVEGSEEGDGFRGFELGVSGKSALAGYIRGWGGIAGTVACGFAGYWAGTAFGGSPWNVVLAVLLPILAVVSFFIWNSKLWIPIQGVIHAVTLAALLMPVAGRGDRETLLISVGIANGLLVLYSLTRLWDHASRERAIELVQAMGMDRETAEEMLDERMRGPGQRREED